VRDNFALLVVFLARKRGQVLLAGSIAVDGSIVLSNVQGSKKGAKRPWVSGPLQTLTRPRTSRKHQSPAWSLKAEAHTTQVHAPGPDLSGPSREHTKAATRGTLV
jgi:hypothetical protein